MNYRGGFSHPFVWLQVYLAFCFCFVARDAVCITAQDAARLDAAIVAEMQKQQVVGLAIGVLRNGRIEYVQTYGWADREQRAPVTSATLFRWASCTKPLAATAALQLCQAGKLDLAADIRQYVPEFPETSSVITIRHLLCHQSGVGHYLKIPVPQRTYSEPHSFVDPINCLDTFSAWPLVHLPGEGATYSTQGYMLLTAAIHRAGEMHFAEQIRNRIAKPLGMDSLVPDYAWVNMPNRAVGYKKHGSAIVRSGDTDQSWKWGAGGYISNIGDFAKFAEGVLNRRFLSPDMERLMWQNQRCNDGSVTKYGLGFSISTDGGRLKIDHNGVQEKTRTRIVLYPKEGRGMVLMTNSEWVSPSHFTTLAFTALSRR